ncbi:unnamed protein product [Trichobilharzia regenti]|nr:unnamed protein product [Trichobilharzia regenti]
MFNIKQLLIILLLYLTNFYQCYANVVFLTEESGKYQQQIQQPLESYGNAASLETILGASYYPVESYDIDDGINSGVGEAITSTDYLPQIEYQAYNNDGNLYHVPVVYGGKYSDYVNEDNDYENYIPQVYQAVQSEYYPNQREESYTPERYEVVNSQQEEYTPEVYLAGNSEYYPNYREESYTPERYEVVNSQQEEYTPEVYLAGNSEYYTYPEQESYTPERYGIVNSRQEEYTPEVHLAGNSEYYPNYREESYTPEVYKTVYPKNYPIPKHEKYTPHEYKVENVEYYPKHKYEQYKPEVYVNEDNKHHLRHRPEQYNSEVYKRNNIVHHGPDEHEKYKPEVYETEHMEYYPKHDHKMHKPVVYEDKSFEYHPSHKQEKYAPKVYETKHIKPYPNQEHKGHKQEVYETKTNEYYPIHGYDNYKPKVYEAKVTEYYPRYEHDKYKRSVAEKHIKHHQPIQRRTSLGKPINYNNYYENEARTDYNNYAEYHHNSVEKENQPDYSNLPIASNKHQKYVPNKLGDLHDYIPIDDKLYVIHPKSLNTNEYKVETVTAKPNDYYFHQPSIRYIAQKKANGNFKNIYPKLSARYQAYIQSSQNDKKVHYPSSKSTKHYYLQQNKPVAYSVNNYQVKSKPLKRRYNGYFSPKSLFQFGDEEKSKDYLEVISYHHSAHQGPKGKIKNYSHYDMYGRLIVRGKVIFDKKPGSKHKAHDYAYNHNNHINNNKNIL